MENCKNKNGKKNGNPEERKCKKIVERKVRIKERRKGRTNGRK